MHLGCNTQESRKAEEEEDESGGKTVFSNQSSSSQEPMLAFSDSGSGSISGCVDPPLSEYSGWKLLCNGTYVRITKPSSNFGGYSSGGNSGNVRYKRGQASGGSLLSGGYSIESNAGVSGGQYSSNTKTSVETKDGECVWSEDNDRWLWVESSGGHSGNVNDSTQPTSTQHSPNI